VPENFVLPVTEKLCDSVLSLPIHTEMNEELLNFISGHVKDFFENAEDVEDAKRTMRNAK
jgi:dTDP-4-amino-4,6-dideoxygalactose transaminase